MAVFLEVKQIIERHSGPVESDTGQHQQQSGRVPPDGATGQRHPG
jgi:hypothetical protein